MIRPILRFPLWTSIVLIREGLTLKSGHQLGNAALPALQLYRQRHWQEEQCSSGSSAAAAALAITAQQQQQLSH